MLSGVPFLISLSVLQLCFILTLASGPSTSARSVKVSKRLREHLRLLKQRTRSLELWLCPSLLMLPLALRLLRQYIPRECRSSRGLVPREKGKAENSRQPAGCLPEGGFTQPKHLVWPPSRSNWSAQEDNGHSVDHEPLGQTPKMTIEGQWTLFSHSHCGQSSSAFHYYYFFIGL